MVEQAVRLVLAVQRLEVRQKEHRQQTRHLIRVQAAEVQVQTRAVQVAALVLVDLVWSLLLTLILLQLQL